MIDTDKSGSVDIDEFMVYIQNNNIMDEKIFDLVMNVIFQFRFAKLPEVESNNCLDYLKNYPRILCFLSSELKQRKN